MGVETAVIGTLLATSIGSSLYSGYQQKQAAKSEAGLMEDQGRLELEESKDEAARRAKEIRKFSARQKLAFIKNGVRLEGSPLDVIDETLTEGQKEVDSVLRRGNALYDLRTRQADNLKKSGRAALIGGIGSASGSVLSAFGNGSIGSKGGSAAKAA